MRVSSALMAALCLVSACGHDYVKVDMPLGRVVVYRNGVAFFERRARVTGDELTLSVPPEKVDDFLKSLTVVDAESGKSLPVSFPSQTTNASGMIEMVVRLPKRRSTDVILTYITEAPAWKPSYRVVVGDNGQVELEGWAIVDNTSGENWKDVLVGVGSSSALSFRYDLWSIRDVQRQTLASEDRFAIAPPTGAAAHAGAPDPSSGPVITELGDADINRPGTHPERSPYASSGGGGGGGDGPQSVDEVALGGVMAEPAPDYDDYEDDGDEYLSAAPAAKSSSGSSRRSRREIEEDKREAERRAKEQAVARSHQQKNERIISKLAEQLARGKQKVIIEGYASASEDSPEARALDRANTLRNQLIERGVAPDLLSVRSGGAAEGRPAGVRLVADQSAAPEEDSQTQEGAPVGESHFQSRRAVTLERGTSVMVSIVKDQTPGEIVYLYDAESERGNARYAFRAARFENPTQNTLEAGPVTVYGNKRFIGEGLTEPIPPRSLALVPFALDRQILVDVQQSPRDEIEKLTRLERGALTSQVRHLRKTTYQLSNRSTENAVVYVRHTVLDGWKLTQAPEKQERIGAAHLFPVQLAAGASAELIVEESTPMTKTLDLRTPSALALVELYLSDAAARKTHVREQMVELLALHREVANRQQAIDSLEQRMSQYRRRMDELHAQIVTLKAVKSGGSLMRHLNDKLKEVSERVQKATIESVEEQEKLLMAKIRFQDAIAELSLEPTAEGVAAAR